MLGLDKNIFFVRRYSFHVSSQLICKDFIGHYYGTTPVSINASIRSRLRALGGPSQSRTYWYRWGHMQVMRVGSVLASRQTCLDSFKRWIKSWWRVPFPTYYHFMLNRVNSLTEENEHFPSKSHSSRAVSTNRGRSLIKTVSPFTLTSHWYGTSMCTMEKRVLLFHIPSNWMLFWRRLQASWTESVNWRLLKKNNEVQITHKFRCVSWAT